MTEITDPQTAQRWEGGSILAGKTITVRYACTADPAGGDLTGATLRAYTVDQTTGIATAIDVDTITDTATQRVATVQVTFPDDLTRRTIVVTFDLDQGDVDLDSAEVAYDVIARQAQPPDAPS